MLASMRPARTPEHQRMRVYLRPPLEKYDLRPILLTLRNQIVETMTITIASDLPTIAYQHAKSPQEAHELIRQAQQQGPIAMGRHGPEVLTYELVRTVWRDDRIVMPKGLALAAQGSPPASCGTSRCGAY